MGGTPFIFHTLPGKIVYMSAGMIPEMHNRHLSARFSAAGHTYREAAKIQQQVADQTVNLVPDHFSAKSILDAGCGTGTAMDYARARWPSAAITGLDIAPGMIEKARSEHQADRQMDFLCADMVTYRAASTFDLVLSSSALHWARPIERGLQNLFAQLSRGGLLAAGVMLDGTLPELREARRAAAPGKKLPARLPTLDQWTAAIQRLSGARLVHARQSLNTNYEKTARDVLLSLHDTGVTGGDLGLAGSPLNRSELAAVESWYDERYGTAEGVPVTFAVGYLLIEAAG